MSCNLELSSLVEAVTQVLLSQVSLPFFSLFDMFSVKSTNMKITYEEKFAKLMILSLGIDVIV